MDMYFLEKYYFDYDRNIPKKLNHIQSKYTKLRTCLEKGKMEGEGSDLARAYKMWIETFGFNDLPDIYSFAVENLELPKKFFTGEYYNGVFNKIPKFYTYREFGKNKKKEKEERHKFILLNKEKYSKEEYSEEDKKFFRQVSELINAIQ